MKQQNLLKILSVIEEIKNKESESDEIFEECTDSFEDKLDFCFEHLFKTRAAVETRNFISLKPDFSSSVNLFEEPSAFFADRNIVPIIFDTGAKLAITISKEGLSLLNLFIGHVSWWHG